MWVYFVVKVSFIRFRLIGIYICICIKKLILFFNGSLVLLILVIEL